MHRVLLSSSGAAQTFAAPAGDDLAEGRVVAGDRVGSAATLEEIGLDPGLLVGGMLGYEMELRSSILVMPMIKVDYGRWSLSTPESSRLVQFEVDVPFGHEVPEVVEVTRLVTSLVGERDQLLDGDLLEGGRGVQHGDVYLPAPTGALVLEQRRQDPLAGRHARGDVRDGDLSGGE